MYYWFGDGGWTGSGNASWWLSAQGYQIAGGSGSGGFGRYHVQPECTYCRGVQRQQGLRCGQERARPQTAPADRYFGLLFAGRVTPANISDNRGARELLYGLAPLMPRLELIWADTAYAGEKLRSWCAEHTGWQLEIVPRNIDNSTFEVLPRCWVVERSIAWISRNWRLARDYERKVQTSECWIKVAMIRLMLSGSEGIEQHSYTPSQREDCVSGAPLPGAAPRPAAGLWRWRLRRP